MAMPKLFGQVLEKLEMLTNIQRQLDRMEAKLDRVLGQPAAQARTMPRDEPTMQGRESLAQKMQKTGDFAQGMTANPPVKPVKK